MIAPASFVDIHCHLIPAMDDGARSWTDTLAMARLAVADGVGTIVATPHQLGNFSHNHGDVIRRKTSEIQGLLEQHDVPLRVLPGGDVRIEPDMVSQLQLGNVLTLADRQKHVLLELPHELYFPLETLLSRLQAAGLVGVLSHPERNQGLLAQPGLVPDLVDGGCLMQVTAGSLYGTFGSASRRLAESMLQRGLVHFIATDAHGSTSRRPLMSRAFERVTELTDDETAWDLCCRHPALVCEGRDVPAGKRSVRQRRIGRWFGWSKAG